MPPGRPKGSNRTNVQHVQTTFPIAMFQQVRAFAKSEYLSIKDAILKCIKLGLFLRKHVQAGNEIFVERNGERTKIMFLD